MNFSFGENIQYKQFQDFMHSNEMRELNIRIQQHQYGNQFNTTGNLYFINNNQYVYDTKEQRISYESGTLCTINKVTQQIIYDEDIDDSMSIINLLSGADNRIEIRETVLEKEGFRIPFFLNDWDIDGEIWTVPTTGKPIKIKLVLAEDEYIILNINSIRANNNIKIPEFEINGYEIIDLRE